MSQNPVPPCLLFSFYLVVLSRRDELPGTQVEPAALAPLEKNRPSWNSDFAQMDPQNISPGVSQQFSHRSGISSFFPTVSSILISLVVVTVAVWLFNRHTSCLVDCCSSIISQVPSFHSHLGGFGPCPDCTGHVADALPLHSLSLIVSLWRNTGYVF